MQALAILSIFLTWAFYALICVGLGAWLPRALKSDALIDLPACFLAGLATLLALLQLWHFVAPINFIPHITLILLGIAGSLTIRKSTLYSLATPPRYALLLFLLTAIWLANRATGPNAEYDAGLYHIPAIKWTESFRIVPGLANLHMRFGFSSTLTLLAAFLDQGFWQGNASHLLNGFFLAALAAMIIRSGTKILTSASPAAADWLLLFTAPLLTDWALDIQASSYSTDIGAAVLTLLAAYYFLRTFSSVHRKTNGFLCILLAAAAIAAKASTLFLCIPMIAVTLFLLRRAALPSLLAAAAFLVPWICRQIILSGYPLYPSELLSLPVDWKVPFAKVRWLHHIMLNWARWMSYDDAPSTSQWLLPWLNNRLLPANMIWKCLLPATIGIGTLIVVAGRRKWQRGPACLLAGLLLAIIGWYNSAPDPRYASQIFCLLMASAFAMIARRPATTLIALLLAIAPLLYGRNIWITPSPTGLFHPTPASAYTKTITAAGLEIYTPVPPPGSTFEDRVWNAPLPNAPASEIDVKEVDIPPLRLRHSPNLQDGFSRPSQPP